MTSKIYIYHVYSRPHDLDDCWTCRLLEFLQIHLASGIGVKYRLLLSFSLLLPRPLSICDVASLLAHQPAPGP